MTKYYFTFGSGQENENCFTVIEGSWADSRNKMLNMYGFKWSHQYSEEEWVDKDGVSQQEKYNLKEI